MIDTLGKVFNKTMKVTKVAYKEAVKPESFDKGEDFQNFVKNMFPDYEWAVSSQTHDYNTNKERFIEDSKNPDFLFRHRRSNREIYVECKFKSDTFHDKIEWCSISQLERYKRIDNQGHNVYIIIGFRGTARNPELIFRIPLSEIPSKWTGLYLSWVDRYKIDKNHKFTLWEGKLK